MKLNITDEAKKMLTDLKLQDKPNLVLWYDTDDCGCAVNGVATVRFTDKMDQTFEKVENDTFDTYVDKGHVVFFQPHVTLDYANRMFRLKNANEMLNAFISPTSLTNDLY